MLLNTVMPRVNTSSWMLNTSGGTRHTAQGQDGFMTAAFAVLGLVGGRSSLVPDILPELQQEEIWYAEPGQADSAMFRRAFGNSIALVALAAAGVTPAQGTIPPTSASTSTGAKTLTTSQARNTGTRGSAHSHKRSARYKKTKKKRKPSRRRHSAKHAHVAPRTHRQARHY